MASKTRVPRGRKPTHPSHSFPLPPKKRIITTVDKLMGKPEDIVIMMRLRCDVHGVRDSCICVRAFQQGQTGGENPEPDTVRTGQTVPVASNI